MVIENTPGGFSLQEKIKFVLNISPRVSTENLKRFLGYLENNGLKPGAARGSETTVEADYIYDLVREREASF